MTLDRHNDIVFMGIVSGKPKITPSIISALSRGRIETISHNSPASASSPFATGVPGLAKSTEVPKIRRYRGHAW